MWVTSSRTTRHRGICSITTTTAIHNIRHNEEPTTCSVCRGNDVWNMDRHTDHGSNVHQEWRSVAAMLVYLSTCRDGGGTTTLYYNKHTIKSKQQPCSKRQSSPIESQAKTSTLTAKDSDPSTSSTKFSASVIETTVLISPIPGPIPVTPWATIPILFCESI